MIRVVADTHVYVSMFGGLPGTFLESFTLLASAALLHELEEKLRLKWGVSPEDRIRTKLESFARMVNRVLNVDDPDDNRVLEKPITWSVAERHLLAS
jgi:hypothetical protein